MSPEDLSTKAEASPTEEREKIKAYIGTVEDEEDRELLKASMLTTMRLAKQIAKKKFTPNKYK